METKNKKVFGIYEDSAAAHRAVEELLSMGYHSDEISVLSKDKGRMDNIDGVDISDVDIDDVDTATESGLKGGAATGATIGGVGGLLAGLGALAIPGIGPILAAGPLVAALTGALAGGAIGGTIGTIAGALMDAGLSEEDAQLVDEQFHAGNIIVYVETDDSRIDEVSRTLNYLDQSDFEPIVGYNNDIDPADLTSYSDSELPKADPNNYSGSTMPKADPNNYSGSGVDKSDYTPTGETEFESVKIDDPIGGQRFEGNYITQPSGMGSAAPLYEPADPLEHNDSQRIAREEEQDDRSYNNLMAGAGRVNPVDPTVSTGYTRTETSNFKEETIMKNQDKSRFDADNLDRKDKDNPLDKAKDWVDEKVDDVKDAFDDKDKKDVKNTYNKAENKVQDTADDVKHDVRKNTEKVERRIDNAGDPLEDTKNWAGDKVSDIKHETGKVVDKIKNRTDK